MGSKHSDEPDPLDPEIIQRLENHYRYVDVDPAYYLIMSFYVRKVSTLLHTVLISLYYLSGSKNQIRFLENVTSLFEMNYAI